MVPIKKEFVTLLLDWTTWKKKKSINESLHAEQKKKWSLYFEKEKLQYSHASRKYGSQILYLPWEAA